jgi:polyisoprenoid-binding protein YceI
MSKIAYLAVALAAVAAVAQAAPAPRPPPVRDYKAAPAGNYVIDKNHAAIVARVPHQGFSYSVFRFGDVKGTLSWDPAKPEASALSVSIDPKSVATPVGTAFAEEIAGERFLKSGAFPAITFVSKSFAATDAAHGKVSGDLTLLGVTKPIILDAELVGAGLGGRGAVMGVSARGQFNPNDFGLTLTIPGAPVLLNLDLEFDRQADPKPAA